MILRDRPTHYTLDPDGMPVPCRDLIAHARWMTAQHEAANMGLLRVALTTFRNDQELSTVFLGSDMAWDGPPLLWETCLLPDCSVQERYASEVEALAGHERLLAEIMRPGGHTEFIVADLRALRALEKRARLNSAAGSPGRSSPR